MNLEKCKEMYKPINEPVNGWLPLKDLHKDVNVYILCGTHSRFNGTTVVIAKLVEIPKPTPEDPSNVEVTFYDYFNNRLIEESLYAVAWRPIEDMPILSLKEIDEIHLKPTKDIQDEPEVESKPEFAF